MNIEISDLIKKSFSYYDKQNDEYKKYIDNDDIELEMDKSTILFKKYNKKFKYEALGVFDNSTNIWIWAWLMPFFERSKKKISEDLLYYGLKLEPKLGGVNNDPVEFYLKTQLVNSRFLLDDNFQLELHLALASYLAKDNFKFIYPRIKYLNADKTKFITVYYLII